jgi:uncharacterized protein YabN with tetrapyrrole methylase and pyrophosphatase domain
VGENMKKKGKLTIVGSGIKSISHITTETRNIIRNADKVLYILADFLTKKWIVEMNSSSEDMHRFYENDKPRQQSYEEMNEYTLSFVRKNLNVCVVYYGHPGVFCTPGHLSVKQAREEGYEAVMLPGISAEDCLFGDLNIDPAKGCQSFEATDFLLYQRIFDPCCNLVLWQIGVTGHLDFQLGGYNHKDGVKILTDYLLETYPENHQVTVYEASTYGTCEPIIQRINLINLPEAIISSVSTLFVPPYLNNFKGANLEMIKKLNISSEHIAFKRIGEIING